MGHSGSRERRISHSELRRSTRFESDEIHILAFKFRKEYPKGVIDKAKFVQLYQDTFPDSDADVFAERVFDMFDDDKSGTINFREFLVGLSATSRGTPAEKLKWSFQIYDLDSDGFLTREEVTEIVKSILKLRGKYESANIEDEVLNVFQGLDRDGDEKLSEQEFVLGIQTTPGMTDLLLEAEGAFNMGNTWVAFD